MESEQLVEILPPEFTRDVVLMDFQCAVVPKVRRSHLCSLSTVFKQLASGSTERTPKSSSKSHCREANVQAKRGKFNKDDKTFDISNSDQQRNLQPCQTYVVFLTFSFCLGEGHLWGVGENPWADQWGFEAFETSEVRRSKPSRWTLKHGQIVQVRVFCWGNATFCKGTLSV